MIVAIYCAICFDRSTAAFIGNTNARRIQRPCPETLNMALTPVGPFCPFRSSASIEVASNMETLNAQTPEFATELARIQLDMEMGNTPDKERLLKVAYEIDNSVDLWEALLTRLQLSGDYQTNEYAKLTQAHLQTQGLSAKGIASMMKWQSGCMKAMALNRPPPMPPSEIDLNAMMAQSQQGKGLSMTAMTSAEKVTASPFTENDSVFDNPIVKEEYTKLCRDHANLIEMGAKYGNFDSSGKIAFLDAIELIGERWDVFFARFNLMGKIDKKFMRECDTFLASMGLNEEEFKKLLKKAHKIMRADAEK